jgi:LPPG:FO 2-phospho-L-lactate transferase
MSGRSLSPRCLEHMGEYAEAGSVVALSGGVGGAKLVLGLSRVLPRGRLIVIANTGDDFVHLGLHVSPDVDTLVYTLAGLANPDTGWGRRDETWTFMQALEALDGESWFRLGDADLATHVERTRRLRAGERLSRVTADFCTRLGVHTRVLPMSDDPVRTLVHTAEGTLPFQEYFVRRVCAPAVTGLTFAGAAAARAPAEVLAALTEPGLRAVIICPSNPFISIDPILAVPGVRAALCACRAPVVAVSPIIGGRAVKGPTAKMMRELGLPVAAAVVARRYGDLLDGYVLDRQDAHEAESLELTVTLTDTRMDSVADRERLARATLAAADALRRCAPAAGDLRG